MSWVSVTKKVKKKYDAEGRVIEKTVTTTKTRDDYTGDGKAAGTPTQENHTDENEPETTAVSPYTNINDLCRTMCSSDNSKIIYTMAGEQPAVELQG